MNGTDAQAASSGAIAAARAKKASAGSSGAVARDPPGVVAPRTSARIRSGWRNASSWATIPPREIPYTCAASSPAASRTATASSAICATV
jgi:hypothetical protein